MHPVATGVRMMHLVVVVCCDEPVGLPPDMRHLLVVCVLHSARSDPRAMASPTRVLLPLIPLPSLLQPRLKTGLPWLCLVRLMSTPFVPGSTATVAQTTVNASTG